MYLSGAAPSSIARELADGSVGFLKTAGGAGNTLDGVAVWAMDNGAFTGKYPGDDAYLALLDRLAEHRDRCLFVAVPDVVGEAEQTLALFPAMAARIRAAGWPVALVGQDGMEHLAVPWELADWVFIGGSTAWKLGGARAFICQAKDHGKRIHIGRVNSGRRFATFAGLWCCDRHDHGCDTADGTYLAFGPDTNAPKLRGWMRAAAHPTLWRTA